MTLHHINIWTEHVSQKIYTSGVTITLREKCPNTEFFLVRIQENTDQKNSVFGHISRSARNCQML